MELYNPLIQCFEQMVLTLGGYLQYDSTSIAQRASKVIVKYIGALDKHFQDLLVQANKQLVSVLLD